MHTAIATQTQSDNVMHIKKNTIVTNKKIHSLEVVTGKPGSDKTTHLKLMCKSMIKVLNTHVIIVDGYGKFQAFRDYCDSYANLLEEFAGKLIEAPIASKQLALINTTKVLGIDVSDCSTNERLNSLLQIARYIKQITSDGRPIYWVLEEAWSLGILARNSSYLQQLLDYSGEHCLIAISTTDIHDITRTGFDLADCSWIDFDKLSPIHSRNTQTRFNQGEPDDHN